MATSAACCNSQKEASCFRSFDKSTEVDETLNMNKLNIEPENKNKSMALAKRHGRGAVLSGLTHECGVFGAMACGEWPSQVNKSSLALKNNFK